MGQLYIRHLPDEVRAGRVPESAVDEAVRRVLRVKIRLGLFERPDIDPARVDAAFPTPRVAAGRPGGRARNLRAAAKPGRRPAGRGRDARRSRSSARSPTRPATSSVRTRRAAIAQDASRSPRASAAARRGGRHRGDRYAPGCDLFCTTTDGLRGGRRGGARRRHRVRGLRRAAGDSGEAASRARSRPSPAARPELLEALLATGKPVVLVLVAGRPLELGPLRRRAAPAIMMAWYPGTEGGTALADVLFGDAGPSGKLPVSYPRHRPAADGLQPPAERPPDAARTTASRSATSTRQVSPLFPFGWGLELHALRLLGAGDRPSPASARSDTARASASRSRIAGPRAGQEVVQLYTRDPVASRSRARCGS